MHSVTNLAINQQSGSNTYYASWDFNDGASTSGETSGSVKVGDLVSIASDATYYNGTSIPSWVKNLQWYVASLKGDRAVLGKDASGAYNIQSPVNVKYLSGGTGDPSAASELDHYEVKWYYDTGNDVWFSSGGSSNVTEKNATYNAPDNAVNIKVSVRPVAKTHTVNKVETPYWDGTWASETYGVEGSRPDKPNKPAVVIKDFVLTATVDNIYDTKADEIEFQVYDGTDKKYIGTSTVLACRAIFETKVAAGGNYRVRCRAVNTTGVTKMYSDWSEFTDDTTTVPKGVTNPKCAAESATSVKVSWNADSTATSYTVEYTINKWYFDSSSEVQSLTVTGTSAYINGLDAREWFFRVRAVNSAGESSWSSIISITIGSKPEPPTTWSLTTTAIVGEEIILYWVHNAEDGSKQTGAQIMFDVGGVQSTVNISGTGTEDEDETICSYKFDAKSYSDGAVIKWKVRTKGVTGEYGDWSTQRSINLYAPPTLSMVMTANDEDVLETLPLELTLNSGPSTQTPMSYHITVIANGSYESDDATGNPVVVTAGTEVYSRVFSTSEHTFKVQLSAGDITLCNNQTYTVKAVVAMDSGLTAENAQEFYVFWGEYSYTPGASVAVDFKTLSAYISPFCVNVDGSMTDDVRLAVYRREYDGTFTEIASELKNDRALTVTDPHPALDYARYRIVARQMTTGAVFYEDLPGVPIKEPGIVIQWDEHWSAFDYAEEDEFETPPWVGSMVRLPYNVDISESHAPDVSLIEYIGRKHPVSYYGTQRGEGGSWSTEIPATDKETIYALRRLAAWNGNAYVRESSGVGYWANVNVSMSTKHMELVVPVSFEIKRVEGGI